MADDVPRQTLFPIPLSNDKEQGAASYLFPCIGLASGGKGKCEETGQEWLTNASFKGSDVKLLNTVEESCHAPSGPSESESESEVCQAYPGNKRELHKVDQRSQKVKHKRRRKHSDSSSSPEPKADESERRNKHKKKHKKHKHKKKLSSNRDSTNEDLNKPNTIWIEESGLEPEKAFRVHKKPDRENLMYGGLYRLDIASYKLKPNFSCLGLSKKQSVKLTDQKKNKKKRQERLRYWNSEDLPRASSVQFAGKGTDIKTLEAPDNDCFVPLESANRSEDRAEETTAADEQEDEGVCRTREFNKLLRDNPQDVNTWLAFAMFQEESVYKGNSTLGSTFTESGNEKHRKASKVVTEKKVAVLEKALEQNAGSVELIVTHLELCSEIWETEKLVERWKKVIFTHPNKTLLWKHYLLFVQSRYSAFSFPKAQSVYHKCLSTLSSIKEGTFTSHQTEGDVEEDMLELFVQMCHFLRQSGHTEKAVASFQAMVELNCRCPATLEQSTPASGQIAFLETFWDSGDPRFGEEGACGLQAWMESSSTCPAPAEDTIDIKGIFKVKGSDCVAGEEEEEPVLDKGRPKWEAWLQVETNRENSHTRPWQPNKSVGETEEDCEDPERLVLFDDISSGLFKLNNPGHKLVLVLHFLECLGVPVLCLQPTTSSDVQNYFSVCIGHKDQLLDTHAPLYAQCLGLQKSSKWMAQTDGSSTRPSPQLIYIIRNVFVQSLPMFGGEAKSLLMVMWLCFEFNLCQQQKTPKERKQKYKDVRKLSRALLKQPSNRNDLVLWQTFAEMEWTSGNREEARRVFDATLTMGSEMFSEDKRRREALLPTFRSYAELEMGITSQMEDERSDDFSMRTLHILTSYAEGTRFEPLTALSEVSPVRVLRARKTFQQEVADILTAVDSGLVQESGVILPSGSFIVHLTSCHALFEYLTTGIDGAVAIYDEALLRLKQSSSVDHELVCTSYVRLLNFHSKRHILPLKQIRRAMIYALEQFPDNPEFLDFYIQLEIKSNVSGQARRFFDKATQKGSSPVPWIFALHYEHLRSEAVLSIRECTMLAQTPGEHKESSMMTSLPPTGITHRQRSLFDRALVSPTARHCVALWRMYMQFEMQNGDRDKARSVFYQALQHCPWAKVVYVDAVKHFPHELEDIMDLMTEKGLRVRTPLEEIEVLLEE